MLNKCLFHENLLTKLLESLHLPLVHQSCQTYEREREKEGEEERRGGAERRLAFGDVRKFVRQSEKFAKRQVQRIWTISHGTSEHLKSKFEGYKSLFF